MGLDDTKNLGDQDAEKRNSPVLNENDVQDFVFYDRHRGASCFFNDRSYPEGSLVRSGTTLMRCDHGLWVIAGNGDSDKR